MSESQRKKYARAIAAAASALGRAPDGGDDELDSLLATAATALQLAAQRMMRIPSHVGKDSDHD